MELQKLDEAGLDKIELQTWRALEQAKQSLQVQGQNMQAILAERARREASVSDEPTD